MSAPLSKSFNLDYKDVVPFFTDNYVTLAIEDPQYGIGESSKNHKSRNTPVRQKNGSYLQTPGNDYFPKDWDDEPPEDDYFELIARVSVNYIMFGANYFKQIVGSPFKPPRRKDFADFLKEYPKGWIIWDKLNGGNDFSDCELIYTTLDFQSFVLPYMWNGMIQGKSMKEPDVQIGDKSLNEKRIQPAQKPVVLYKWLLQKFYWGGTVLDTHLGSGSSRIACYDLGIPFIGIEKDKGNYDRQEDRFNNHKIKIELFRGY